MDKQSNMDKPASLATAQPAADPPDGSYHMQMLVGRADNSGARGFGCWLWISRPQCDQFVHSRDAASWPSPHASNSHSFSGPPPFPCHTKVCALTGRVNALCT
jgi:hypothetical protein